MFWIKHVFVGEGLVVNTKIAISQQNLPLRSSRIAHLKGLSELYNAEISDEASEAGSCNRDTSRYVNPQFLAEGGMKKVYRVEDSVTGKQLARAELRPQATAAVATALNLSSAFDAANA